MTNGHLRSATVHPTFLARPTYWHVERRSDHRSSKLVMQNAALLRARPSSPNSASHPAARDAPAAPGWPWSLCQPSGPDGEGQAKGQARLARGKPQL